MSDIMIDFETLDTGNMPVLLSVGAVIFDSRTSPNNRPFVDFERIIDVQSCIDVGGSISGDTIKWWMGQSGAARKKITHPDKEPQNIKDVMIGLAAFCKANKVKKVWGHGATFDVVIAENYFKKLGLDIPWKFWNVRDTRTLFDLTGIERTPIAIKHSALEDARGQAIDVIRCCVGFRHLVDKLKEIEEKEPNE